MPRLMRGIFLSGNRGEEACSRSAAQQSLKVLGLLRRPAGASSLATELRIPGQRV